MNTLVFDIETVPDTELGRRLYELHGPVRRAGRRKSCSPSAARKPAANSCRTSSIASSRSRWSCARAIRLKVWSLGDEGSPEKDLIERFFDGVDKYTPDLVSWNGAGFDLPVLHYRSLLHGITAARYWETGDSDTSFRYSNYLSRFHWRHMDLMDILSGFQGRGRASLQDVAVPARAARASSACTARRSGRSICAGGLQAHPRLLRNRRAQYLSDLSAVRAAARTAERGRACARVRPSPRNCSRSRRPRIFKEFVAAWPASLKSGRDSGGGRRRPRPRRPRHRAGSTARPCSSKARCRASASAIRVLKRRSQLDEAGLVEMLAPSPDRVRPALRAFRRLRRLFPAASGAGGAARRQAAAIARQSRAHRRCAAAAGIRRRCAARIGRIGAAPGSASNTSTRRAGCSRGFRERDKPYLADIRRCEILLDRFATLPAGTGGAGRDALVRGTSCRKSRWRPATTARRSYSGSWQPPSSDDRAQLGAIRPAP